MIAKLKKKYNSKIILIDLQKLQFYQSLLFKINFFKKKIFFTSKDIKKNVSKNDILKNDVIILCPWDNLPNLKIDLFINSRSMMEMTNDTILSYFKQIHNLTKIGGYFYVLIDTIRTQWDIQLK